MIDQEHIIWSNNGLDYEDWRDELESAYPKMTENERVGLMYELNNEYLDDERVNLDIQLKRPIIVIADLGLWHGRTPGYKEIASRNIRDCLYSNTDFSTWYVDDDGDLRCEAAHHDGTNYYLYRTYRDGATDSQIEKLKSKIYSGTATRKDITRITSRLGDEIGRVYGWDFPKRGSAQKEYAR